MPTDPKNLNRRAFNRLATGFGLGAGALATGAGSALAQTNPALSGIAPSVDGVETPGDGGLKRRVSGFKARRWQDHFPNRSNGVILVDTVARALHFWDETGTVYNIYPTSVPLTDELTRRGRTKIIRKQVGPDWRPTPNMLKRDPTLPPYVGPGPENPLGTHALYLTWTYYRIHGTNDVRKIGRRSSSGCIGLYNEQIEQLFALSKVGTQVLLI